MSDRSSNKITNALADSCTSTESLGFAFVKPASEHNARRLIMDFTAHDLQIIHLKRLVLPEEVIDYIYRDSLGKHFYPDMRDYLSKTAVTAMMLAHPTENAQALLMDLKSGNNGRPNLRNKYRPADTRWMDSREMELWNRGVHPKQYETTVALTQANVFHAADNTDDAVLSFLALHEYSSGFLTQKDIKYSHLGWLASIISLGEIMEFVRKEVTGRAWHNVENIEAEDADLPVQQVYTWITTADNKIAVVSKDGNRWQLPGGKPSQGETWLETAQREVFEETGLQTADYIDNYRFFGYYRITEGDDKNEEQYLQLRYALRLDQTSDQIPLSAINEDEEQITDELVKYAKFVPYEKLADYVPWVTESAEMQAAFTELEMPLIHNA